MADLPTPPLKTVSPRPARPRLSALVFSYEEHDSLRRILPVLLQSPLEQIVLMYGGQDGSREYVESIHDPRVVSVYEPERSGKFRAYNRGVSLVRGDIVFLVSGDISLEPSIFEAMAARFTEKVGVVLPRIQPNNIGGPVTRIGQKLWDFHDAQIAEFLALGLPAHGGELQAFRRELLEELPGVVNEDAYLCLRAVERGYRVEYARDLVVGNTVPETLRELILQRSRVNYGHAQLAELGYQPSTLDALATSQSGTFLRVFWRGILDHPTDLWTIPAIVLIEIVSQVRGQRDLHRGRDYTRWALVRTGKVGFGFAAEATPEDPASATPP